MKKNTTILFVLSILFLTSCKSGWTSSDKKAFLDACTLSPEYKEYCNCALEKVMQKAPDPKDASKVNIQEVAASCVDKLKLNF